MKPRNWIILIVVVFGLGSVGWWAIGQHPGFVASLPNRLGLAPQENGWAASGFIEAEQIALAPEVAGRIAALPVAEGDQVSKGTIVLRLEDDLLSAQVEAARARLEEAQATQARVKVGARQESLDKTAAQFALAQVARDAAKQAWLDAQTIRDNPQTLDVQIAAARAQVTVAQKQYEAILLQRDLAQDAWKTYGKTSDKLAGVPTQYRPALSTSFYLIPYQWDQALAATDASKAALDGARAALTHLLEQRSNPQEAQAQVDAAQARYLSADAAAAKAQAALDAQRAGATQEQLAAAQAQVDVAQAALEAAQVPLHKATLRAPIDGLIVTRSVYTGEIAVPGITALTLADLTSVSLTIYVPGHRLSQVTLGQAMSVSVDAFDDRTFPGIVTYISDKAEYTPRSVRTPDQRASLVYAVKIKIANPDYVLKPGIQAEVVAR